MSIIHSASLLLFSCYLCFLCILSCFFFIMGILEGWQFRPPICQRSLHPFHANADDQILMKSDFNMDFQSLRSRDHTVWRRGCDSKMYAKIKKGTFGFRNRTDLFKRPTGLGRSPGSTWSFCLEGLAPLVHQLCSQGSSATANSWSSQLAFTSKAGPQRMFAEWMMKGGLQKRSRQPHRQ